MAHKLENLLFGLFIFSRPHLLRHFQSLLPAGTEVTLTVMTLGGKELLHLVFRRSCIKQGEIRLNDKTFLLHRRRGLSFMLLEVSLQDDDDCGSKSVGSNGLFLFEGGVNNAMGNGSKADGITPQKVRWDGYSQIIDIQAGWCSSFIVTESLSSFLTNLQ